MPLYGWVAFAILGTGLIVLLLGGNSDTLLGMQTEQLGALTAMLALLVYLGGGMFGRGQAIAPLIKSLMLWGALLAAVVIGYWAYQTILGQ